MAGQGRRRGRLDVVGLVGEHVVEAASRIHQLDDVAVAVHVHQPPQLAAGVHAGEKDALVLAVHAKHHVTAVGNVVVHHAVLVGKLFGQGLGPETGLVGEVGAGVLGQVAGQQPRVHGREPEPDGAGPVLGLFHEADENFLVDPHGPVGEDDGFAETLNSEKRKNINGERI